MKYLAVLHRFLAKKLSGARLPEYAANILSGALSHDASCCPALILWRKTSGGRTAKDLNMVTEHMNLPCDLASVKFVRTDVIDLVCAALVLLLSTLCGVGRYQVDMVPI